MQNVSVDRYIAVSYLILLSNTVDRLDYNDSKLVPFANQKCYTYSPTVGCEGYYVKWFQSKNESNKDLSMYDSANCFYKRVLPFGRPARGPRQI